MAKRKVKDTGKGAEVNGEGNEKDDNTSTTTADLSNFTRVDRQDLNPKVAGLANGYLQQQGK